MIQAALLLALTGAQQAPPPPQSLPPATHVQVPPDVAAGQRADDSVAVDDGRVKGRSVPGQAFHPDPGSRPKTPPEKPCPPAAPARASPGMSPDVMALRCPR